MTIPIALTIAGSDSSGGAGIQADLKTFAAFGVYGASVITALTAQNTAGVSAIHQVPADFVTAQIDAVFGDLDVQAVKIGMVAQLATIDAIVAGLTRWSPGAADRTTSRIVLDPVMVATSGDRLLAVKVGHDPWQRQKIVVFDYPNKPAEMVGQLRYVKRLIGLPGETIGIHGGKLYISDKFTYPAADGLAADHQGITG